MKEFKIRASVNELTELLNLMPEQLQILKLLEEVQQLKAKHRHLIKNNPIIKWDSIKMRKSELMAIYEILNNLEKNLEAENPTAK
jgi:hypothetical protein